MDHLSQQRLQDALARYYSAQTIQKLETLATLTEQIQMTSFQGTLCLLSIWAFVLTEVDQQVNQIPLAGPADVVDFGFALDKAGEAINQVLAERFPEEPFSMLHDPVERLIPYLHGYTYALAQHYQQRQERLLSRGKYP